MSQAKPRRKRGVILTPEGKQKLQGKIRLFEQQDNYGEKFTIEELSERTGLDSSTVAKVLDAEEGADRRTLERFFQTFNLPLESDDYRRPPSDNTTTEEQADEDSSQTANPKVQNHVDWGEAVDVSIFYGRTEELETLERWILQDRCRLVALLGMGGIGKTSLAAKLGDRIQGEFEYVVWRSLKDAPPLKEILTSFIQFLSHQQETEADLPETVNARITRLLEYLRTYRCLLILDNGESILQEGQAGVYREGYEGYGELLKRIGESSHQSCLILTSREKPRELSPMEGVTLPVRCWQMRGIENIDGFEILKAKGLELSSRDEQNRDLINRCGGNPLALKLVATTIRELFDGDIAEFLKEETIAFDGVRVLLDQHFDRLSELEKSIMYWLAIDREPVTVQELQDDIIPSVQRVKLMEALKALIERSLIEKTATSFTQQPVVMEYMTERFIEHIHKEICSQDFLLFNSHLLIKASSKNYIRKTQIRLILNPILNSVSEIDKRLVSILKHLRNQPLQADGYVCGNIINLLISIGFDLTGYNLSSLKIWQAYLAGVSLREVNLAGCNLNGSVFNQAFGIVSSVAPSPDGKLLAIGNIYGEIYLLRFSDRKQILLFNEHTSWVNSMSFSPDSQLLVSGSSDNTIKIWDISSHRCIGMFYKDDWVCSVSFSPDGKTIASGSRDGAVSVWDVETYICLYSFQEPTQERVDRVWSVVFSPDGRMLASSSDTMIKIWDVANRQCLHILQTHTQLIRSLAFSLDGQLLASGSFDETIRIWDVETSQNIAILQGHTCNIRSITFSPNGHLLASGGDDKTIRVWDVSSANLLCVFKGHTDIIRSVAFGSNEVLISSADDRTIRIWDADTFKCLQILQGYTNRIWSVAFSPDGELLASGGDEQTIKLWNIFDWQYHTLKGHTDRVWSVAFNPNGQVLASGSSDATVRIWSVHTRQCLHTLKGHTDLIYSIAFSPNGTLLASGSFDRTIRLWNVDTGQLLTVLAHDYEVWSIAFSADGSEIISTDGALIKVWDISTYQCLQILQQHIKRVNSLTLSRFNSILASSSGDRTIRLWNIKRNECLSTFQSSSVEISVTFSPNGKLLASGGMDHIVRIWDTCKGLCIKIFQGHDDWIRSVTFSPNGRILASSSDDQTIRLWDLESDTCIAVLKAARPYENTNITGATGLTDAQRASLIALGAVDEDMP